MSDFNHMCLLEFVDLFKDNKILLAAVKVA